MSRAPEARISSRSISVMLPGTSAADWRKRDTFQVRTEEQIARVQRQRVIMLANPDLVGKLIVLRDSNNRPRPALVVNAGAEGFEAETHGTKGRHYPADVLVWVIGTWERDPQAGGIKAQLNTLMKTIREHQDTLLPFARRQALVAWAERNGTWIVEDDYDSELRYAGHPFPAMQGLSPERVVYLGTFSKVLFPSLRLGYVVAPTRLVEAFAGARALLDRHSPTADQHVLAAYMREGLFEAHVRRIRGLYAERRAALIAALEPALPQGCAIQRSDQGMHILLWLPESADDVRIAARAEAAGLVMRPISPMYAGATGRPGLMLGFGGFTPDRLRQAAGVLGRLLQAEVP